ncbi:MAG: sigma-70 family RNA polymerase sigma factor [Propionibacteriaceae bacterium]|jgi:RNA polymerase sigma factor (sigma-70 family)|nr:sigma-70 family RNA polymerase sigma factor [Propionibacteriaceae bacterium]
MTAVTATQTRRAQTSQSPDAVGSYLQTIGASTLLTADDEVVLAKTIECGVAARAVLDGTIPVDPASPLADATTEELERLAASGEAAMRRFLESNLQLVVSIARRCTGQRIPLSDAIQEGNLGLIRAVEKFDYAQGYKFSTYATWWIRQAISRACAQQGRIVRLPVHVAEQLNQVQKTRRALVLELDREPTAREIATVLELDHTVVVDLLRLASEHISLDAPLDESGDRSLGDLVADTPEGDIEEVVIDQAERDGLDAIIGQLDERSADIVRRRFGLLDGSPAKLADIGRRWGITAERVRQIERKALTTIKEAYAAMSANSR